MQVFDFENHFFSPRYLDFLRRRQKSPRETIDVDGPNMWYDATLCSPRSLTIDNKLVDLGQRRLAEMDANGIDVAILSVSPPSPQYLAPLVGTRWAAELNDVLAAVVRQHPHRFIGLACLAPQDPVSAAAEIDRAVELGLRGLVIHSHARGEYLDRPKYRPIFAQAAHYRLPVYLHPDVPSRHILSGYADYGFELAGPVLGFAADAALHALRLICSGLFDEYPDLQIVMGHLGEGLPYWLDRIDLPAIKPWKRSKLKIRHKPSDYLKRHFTVTTSGMAFWPAFICAYLALGADRIAFAVDYPYEDYGKMIRFIQDAAIPAADKAAICHGNAEKLFGLSQ